MHSGQFLGQDAERRETRRSAGKLQVDPLGQKQRTFNGDA